MRARSKSLKNNLRTKNPRLQIIILVISNRKMSRLLKLQQSESQSNNCITNPTPSSFPFSNEFQSQLFCSNELQEMNENIEVYRIDIEKFRLENNSLYDYIEDVEEVEEREIIVRYKVMEEQMENLHQM